MGRAIRIKEKSRRPRHLSLRAFQKQQPGLTLRHSNIVLISIIRHNSSFPRPTQRRAIRDSGASFPRKNRDRARVISRTNFTLIIVPFQDVESCPQREERNEGLLFSTGQSPKWYVLLYSLFLLFLSAPLLLDRVWRGGHKAAVAPFFMTCSRFSSMLLVLTGFSNEQ